MTHTENTSLQANYGNGAFGGKLGFGSRQALLMIDFAMAYFDPASPLFANRPEVVAPARSLLLWARARKMLVCHTRVEYRPDGLDGGVFFRKVPALQVFCNGNPLGDVVPELAATDDEPVITKQYASAFFGTSLASTLHAQGVDCVVLAGMSTSGCVRASAVDAMQHGFIPVVVSDACGDRHPEPHAANLFDLDAKYADVMTLAQLQSGLTL
ncbi:MAG: isochorismatase family protein [Rhodoferax sp.]|nr:isochorismatase family protein [Rhodoferax sp.]MCB2029042.1 isochorismatase family protein [Rhodoferax sp.]MCB2039496.1 isochorismatase family protein [Rhodoferax sp.]MCP5263612.1 isochorismatase family protein [Rhodoferax sp.]MCW5644492.1 isochorismatase family protein [Rhodoferax sp.]